MLKDENRLYFNENIRFKKKKKIINIFTPLINYIVRSLQLNGKIYQRFKCVE